MNKAHLIIAPYFIEKDVISKARTELESTLFSKGCMFLVIIMVGVVLCKEIISQKAILEWVSTMKIGVEFVILIISTFIISSLMFPSIKAIIQNNVSCNVVK